MFSSEGNWKSVQLLPCSERYVQDVAEIGKEWTLPKEIRKHSCVKCTGRSVRVWMNCAMRSTAQEAGNSNQRLFPHSSHPMALRNKNKLSTSNLKRSRRHGEDSSKYDASSRVFVTIFEVFGSVVKHGLECLIYLLNQNKNFQGETEK